MNGQVISEERSDPSLVRTISTNLDANLLPFALCSVHFALFKILTNLIDMIQIVSGDELNDLQHTHGAMNWVGDGI